MKGAIVVYGSGPQDSYKLTPVERLSITAALSFFFQQKKRVTFILTGGKTGKSQFSEAEVMAAKLIYSGIPEKYIIMEKMATSTIENVVFVANLVDKMGLEHLFHIAPQAHLPRIKELCSLIGIPQISEYKSSEEILGDKSPVIEAAREKLREIAANETRRMKGLKEVPGYWLPQAAEVESLERWKYILCQPRLNGWLRKEFGISPVNFTESNLRKLRRKIKNTTRISV